MRSSLIPRPENLWPSARMRWRMRSAEKNFRRRPSSSADFHSGMFVLWNACMSKKRISACSK